MENSNAGPASSIQAIDRGSVHRICSGQVVLNLATAVKELVENSIDAGATSIEIRLKEYGSEILEVIDNGQGVEQTNFEGLTLKHHTSKLKDFSDLVNVETFGFRGEALSSLCALSKLTVTTCHKTAKIGSRLEYDNNGKLVKKTSCSRQIGTTVTLEQIFSTLPVRHKEFTRNLKKEFTKMVQVLNAYCIISTGVKITCANQTGKGKKNTIVNTSGNRTIRENVTNVFGAKQIQELKDFSQIPPSEECCTQYGLKEKDIAEQVFKIEGMISTCEHGKGRSSTDRQFFFINKRPCDLTKVAKVVNEVYHMYNRHQYPFVLLDMSLEKEAVDVNVTPDKRMVFLQHEKLLLAIIKSSLIKLFEPLSSQFQMSDVRGTQLTLENFSSSTLKKHDSFPAISRSPQKPLLANLKRSFTSAFSKEDHSSISPTKSRFGNRRSPKQRKLDSFVMDEDSGDSSPAGTSMELKFEPVEFVSLSEDAGKTESVVCSSSQTSGVSSEGADSHKSDPAQCPEPGTDSGNSQTSIGSGGVTILKIASLSQNSDDGTDRLNAGDDLRGKGETDVKITRRAVTISADRGDSFCESSGGDAITGASPRPINSSTSASPGTVNPGSDSQSSGVSIAYLDFESSDSLARRRERAVSFSLSALRARLCSKEENSAGLGPLSRRFRAQISPGDNQAAEEELKKEIRKDMFPEMEILGQFNLGFIIVKLGSDLFIVDQHATDEKYNFEMLQKHTILQGQKLIIPQTLHQTAMNETILLDNIDIFKANGFEFSVDEEAPCGQRVKLVSMPVSKNWNFDKNDIDELIFMLSDAPGVMCRPSRIRQMFASRACRKSVMIGTALNKPEMRKLLNHMGEIEQPWNCPHGRPTMRHLINLDMLKK